MALKLTVWKLNTNERNTMSRPTLDQMHPERPFRVHETDAYKGEQVIACLYGSNAWSVDANGNRLQVLGLASAFTVLDKDGEYDHTIATLTAEREKVRELVEAVKLPDIEEARNGFTQAYMMAAKHNDLVGMACMKAHHKNANRIAVNLGSESTKIVDLTQQVKASLAKLKEQDDE